jgi:ABC-type polysaccharide/polyol phosphate export permease
VKGEKFQKGQLRTFGAKFQIFECQIINLQIMNFIKKYLGLLWMAMAPLLIIFMFWQAFEKINAATGATKANVALQWVIILMVFIPICAGFFIFGKYSFHGDYAHLPESSEEIDDYEEEPL